MKQIYECKREETEIKKYCSSSLNTHNDGISELKKYCGSSLNMHSDGISKLL